MYCNAFADRQTIPGSEIDGIPRNVTNRTQDCQQGNKDFGAAFLEKMNYKLF
jgi:hypothetical protein